MKLHLKTGKAAIKTKLHQFHVHGRTIISYKRYRHPADTSVQYGF